MSYCNNTNQKIIPQSIQCVNTRIRSRSRTSIGIPELGSRPIFNIPSREINKFNFLCELDNKSNNNNNLFPMSNYSNAGIIAGNFP